MTVFYKPYRNLNRYHFKGTEVLDDTSLSLLANHLQENGCNYIKVPPVGEVQLIKILENFLFVEGVECEITPTTFDFLVKNMPHLRFLSLDSRKSRGDYALKKLSRLEFLSAGSVNTKIDLSGISSLREFSTGNGVSIKNIKFKANDNLTFLHMGGAKDVEQLSTEHISGLKYLSIVFDNNIPNLDFMSRLHHLEAVYLFRMSKIKRVPDLSHLVNLKKIHALTLNNLEDFTGLGKAPSLEHIYLLNDYSTAKASIFEPLLNIPTLKWLVIGRMKVSEEKKVQEMFGDVLKPRIDTSTEAIFFD